mgnify:CR=1 FL=1
MNYLDTLLFGVYPYLAGAVFLLWKAARGLRDLGWAAFGLGVAAYWTGFWPF